MRELFRVIQHIYYCHNHDPHHYTTSDIFLQIYYVPKFKHNPAYRNYTQDFSIEQMVISIKQCFTITLLVGVFPACFNSRGDPVDHYSRIIKVNYKALSALNDCCANLLDRFLADVHGYFRNGKYSLVLNKI